MFNNSYKLMFLLMMMASSMITISSNTWMGAWMGLEINLLSFIPLMSGTNNLMSSEASLKYFLTQAIASAVLLFASILYMLQMNLSMNMLLNPPSLMITSSLLMKSGAAPFHFWFPTVMEGLTWVNSLILMTWQKVAPLMLISYISSYFILGCAIISAVVGGIGGLNQSSLRKLMAYSSINHLGWMLCSMMYSEALWSSYFLFYSFMSSLVILMFKLFNIFYLNQLFSVNYPSSVFKFVVFLNILSLGGLPPFLGFFPKWMVIQSLSSSSLLSIFVLVMFSLVTLFFYLRMCYSAFFLGFNESNWSTSIHFNKNLMTFYLLMTLMSLIGILMISLWFMLM